VAKHDDIVTVQNYRLAEVRQLSEHSEKCRPLSKGICGRGGHSTCNPSVSPLDPRSLGVLHLYFIKTIQVDRKPFANKVA
jgi:hypothetical protein